MTNKYNLGFISDSDIYEHVRNTVCQYRRSINLEEFNKNVVDPIKLMFDSKIYNQTIKETITTECLRQIDKSNNNCIGYFHQYIFKYAGDGWVVPPNGKQGGFDLVNDKLHIYAEIKNKHNIMNSASSSATYVKMQNKLLTDDKATCYLVEAIAKASHDDKWVATIKTQGAMPVKYQHERIRKISMDRFYGIVFGDPYAFFRLCKALPVVLDDVLSREESIKLKNSVYEELAGDDFLKSLFLLAFESYDGFEQY